MLMAFVVGITSFCASAQNDLAEPSQQTKTYVKIQVDGMACPFCSYGIEKKVRKLDGSADFYVEINDGWITFSVPSDKKPSVTDFEKLITEAGFIARTVEYSDKPFKKAEVRKK